MNINMSLIFEVLFGWLLLTTILGFYLGKRKTTTPKLITLLSFMSAFLPPIGIIFLMVLALKDDISDSKSVA